MTAPDSPMTLHTLNPQQIDLDPTQPRQEIDPLAQAELAASVRVWRAYPDCGGADGDGRYRLLYSERRLRAAQACALPTLPCLVTAPPTALDALDLQLVENLCRSELRPLELAQALWQRILGAQLAALEAEHGDDGTNTEQMLANYLTPGSQIAALEDRLCALAGVADVAAYFGGGRVRVPRQQLLARYGMAHWSASGLKKLFQTPHVAPVVQDMLAGVEVSARALRDLAKHDEAMQAALVAQARTTAAQGNGDLGSALRDALDEQADEHDAPQDKLALLPWKGRPRSPSRIAIRYRSNL